MKHKILFVILFLLALTMFIQFRHSTPEQAETLTAQTDAVEESVLSDKEKLRAQRPLKPSNPADYGMVVVKSGSGLMSEDEINTMIRDKWQDINKQFPKETFEKAKEVIKEDSSKTQEKMAKIEEELTKCRDILQKDPFNEDIKRKQQNLLILKALGREMASLANN